MEEKVDQESPEGGADDETLGEGQEEVGLPQDDAGDDVAGGGENDQLGGEQQEAGDDGGVEGHVKRGRRVVLPGGRHDPGHRRPVGERVPSTMRAGTNGKQSDGDGFRGPPCRPTPERRWGDLDVTWQAKGFACTEPSPGQLVGWLGPIGQCQLAARVAVFQPFRAGVYRSFTGTREYGVGHVPRL